MRRFAFAAVFLALAAPAFADGRYQLQAVEGGVARLDTETGALDFCRTSAEGLSCTPALVAAHSRNTTPKKPLSAEEMKRLESDLTEVSKTMETTLPVLMRTLFSLSASMERTLDEEAQRAKR
jgi:hypothetical protein